MTKKLILAMALTALTAVAVQARTINVRGRVTVQGSGDPLSGVTIYNASSDKLLGVTAADGGYTVSVDSDDDLIFSSLICQELREPVNGRLNIDVVLMPEAKELEEIVVQAKGSGLGLVTEPTDLDVKGNYIHLKTRVKIPQKLFDTQRRMIVQPAIYNVTRRHLTYITPVVYDGWRYASTQERMLDWDTSKDPLTPYQTIKRTGRKAENVIYLTDSLYVEDPNEDFMCVVMSSLEDYNKIIYADTFEIARGTVNPLRFLDYDLAGTGMTDDEFLPSPEVELRDTDGEMNLLFPVGKSVLQLNLGNNAAELQALINEFRAIENDPDMTLKSFVINGSASPEGRYESNRKLAAARMNSAMEKVLESVDESLRRNAEISSHAEVAPWDDVVKMLRADGRDSEADRVQKVIDTYSGMDNRSAAMTRLPFYSLLRNDYLPRLRRVSYHIVSSRYRPLTDEEIAALYDANPAGLTRYQYYRLYTSSAEPKREQVMRQALATYPDFVVAATDLAGLMLERDENPKELLDPFFEDPDDWKRLPQSTRYDMAVACMKAGNVMRADSLLTALPDNQTYHKAKIYCAALNGRYHEVMQEISEDSPLNEVLLLLAVKDNDHAWRRAQKLGGSAVEEYVKAVAANRVDDYMAASTHLENAFRLDPSLREVAKVDGDVVDLLDQDELNSDSDEDDE